MPANWTEEELAAYYARLKAPPAGAPIVSEKPAQDVPERLIALECEKLLQEHGWRTLRCEPTSDRGRGKGFGEVGMADTLCLRYGRKGASCEVMWIEWKRPGGRVGQHQLAWHIRERARGAMTAIAGVDFPASVQGFIGWYHSSGLTKRPW
jgi:hypothetical protein